MAKPKKQELVEKDAKQLLFLTENILEKMSTILEGVAGQQ